MYLLLYITISNRERMTSSTTSQVFVDSDLKSLIKETQTVEGDHFSVLSSQSPRCCFWFYPTHAEIKTDSRHFAWNSRDHRKLRFPTSKDKADHPHFRIIFLGWEPRIISWYIAWIGFIANTLWVVNGVFATWPGLLESKAENISYYTGVVGAILFAIGGYLGYVEAINHTYASIVLPPKSKKTTRLFHRTTHTTYGSYVSPVVGSHEHVKMHRRRFLDKGFPLIQDDSSQQFFTRTMLGPYLEKLEMEHNLIGRKLNVFFGDHVLKVSIESFDKTTSIDRSFSPSKKSASYFHWWTWTPDLKHMGIFNNTTYFMSTVIFLAPAIDWKPMLKSEGASTASLIFWIQVTQVRPFQRNCIFCCCILSILQY